MKSLRKKLAKDIFEPFGDNFFGALGDVTVIPLAMFLLFTDAPGRVAQLIERRPSNWSFYKLGVDVAIKGIFRGLFKL